MNKLTFLLLPLLLGTADYGKIGLIFSLELLLPIVSLLGLDRAILRFYSQKAEFKNFDATVFTSIRVSHLILLLVLVLLKLSGVEKVFGLATWPDVCLIILLVYLSGWNKFVLNCLRVEEKHDLYFQARFILQISKLLLVIGIIWVINDYRGYLYGSIVSALLVNVLFKLESKSKLCEFNKKSFSRLFLFSWPFIFHGFAGKLLSNVDKFIIERYMSLSDVGIYTLAQSIGSMMAFAFIGVSVYMEPLIYKQEHVKSRDKMLNRFLMLTLCFGLIGYLLLSLSAEFIVPHIYGNKYEEAIKFIPLIAISYLVYPFYLKSSYELIYDKKSLNIATVSTISAGVSIALNFWLIPIYGLFAPIYTLAVVFIMQAVGFSFTAKGYRFHKEILTIVALGGCIFFSIYFNLAFYWSFFLVGIFIAVFVVNYLKPLKKGLKNEANHEK